MNDYIVPDATGDPIVAWRCWFVVPENQDTGALRLRSFVYAELWEPGEVRVAECKNPSSPDGIERSLPHPAPDDDHKCGIYAVSSRDQVDSYYRNDIFNPGQWREIWRVIGTVN